jgi:hypothetical protein
MPFFGTTTSTQGWVRPVDWLPLPELQATDNRFVGLLAVTNDSSNLVALSATGAVTVDWGDGSIENFATGVVARHQYNYATIGNLSTLGYKQVIISVTPQLGQTLSTFSLQQVPTGYTSGTNTPWLDIAIAGTSITSLAISQGGTPLVTLGSLRQCRIVSLAPTYASFASMFNNCYALRNVIIPFGATSSGTNFSYMFLNCTSLASVPLFNTAAGTDFSYMFLNCPTLTSVPLFNTSSGTNFLGMFQSCTTLTSVPLFNTSSGTNFSAMFQGCATLASIPLFNTSAGTNFANMFRFCSSLFEVPALNVSSVTLATNFASMFLGCSNLAKCSITGARQTISFSTAPKLAYPELQLILTNLGTAIAGAVVNISSTFGNPSITAADRLIATNKGWTITG